MHRTERRIIPDVLVTKLVFWLSPIFKVFILAGNSDGFVVGGIAESVDIDVGFDIIVLLVIETISSEIVVPDCSLFTGLVDCCSGGDAAFDGSITGGCGSIAGGCVVTGLGSGACCGCCCGGFDRCSFILEIDGRLLNPILAGEEDCAAPFPDAVAELEADTIPPLAEEDADEEAEDIFLIKEWTNGKELKNFISFKKPSGVRPGYQAQKTLTVLIKTKH